MVRWAQVNYKLRDWLFARQRYWGEPFPIIFPEGSEVRILHIDFGLGTPRRVDLLVLGARHPSDTLRLKCQSNRSVWSMK